ncbi:MAG: DinB family protein [Saprospiraceae bacterium]|nr:DinB family protein [Saprospiraceae bacterium]
MLVKIEQLESIVEESLVRIKLIPDSVWLEKSDPLKWSKKEILGHLIDSAQNNLRRVIVAQYDTQEKIVYDQDFWVQAQNYQLANTDEIIELWYLINKQLIRSFLQLPADKYHFTTNVGRTSIEFLNMEELLDMYIEHLDHHLNQIL